MKIISETGGDLPVGVFTLLTNKWFTRRGETGLPPMDFFTNMPNSIKAHCFFARMEMEPFRVYYEFAGEQLEQLYGESLNGAYVDDLYSPWIRMHVHKSYKKSLEIDFPTLETKTFATIFKNMGYHRLIMPIMGDDGHRCAVTCVIPTDKHIQQREDWHSVVEATPWL